MAAPTNYDQTNDWLAQVSQGVADLVAILKGGIDVGQSGTLGNLSLVDTLSAAPVGNAATLRDNLGFVAAALTEMQKYGIGSVGAPRLNDIGQIGAPTSIYSFNASTGTTGELPSFSAGTIIYGYSAAGNETYPSELAIDRAGGKMEFRSSNGSQGWSTWTRTWNSKNTTVDSNGFIKSASPIFRLANVAESAEGDGFTLDGCGAYNSEAEGVTATHDDLGVYTVTGSLGFADDGWTIEIPQDVNGNRLCFVETETAEDGTITVLTFGRRFDYETAMIVAGDPIDIPEGRWIDLRLKVPEPDQVEQPDAGDEAATEE